MTTLGMDSYVTAVVAILSIAFILYKVLMRAERKNGLKVLPSFPRLPLVGSLPFLTTLDNLHVFFAEKTKKYGNIYALYAANNYTVVLNGYDVIREALMKKSTEFAGRKQFFSDGKVINPYKKGLGPKQYGEEFKRIHQVSVAILKQYGFGDSKVMETRITDELTEFINYVNSMKGKTFNPTVILQESIQNIVYSLTLGKRATAVEGNDLQRWLREIVNSLDPVLDIFPVLQHLPKYSGMLKELETTRDEMKQFFSERIHDCAKGLDGNENFAKDYIKQMGDKYDEEELIFILRDVVMAGTETTATQLAWFLILIGNSPDFQRRLRKEINSVVPADRYPSMDDKDKLRLVEATMLEVMRLRTMVPLAVPHLTLADTEVQGFSIPANSMVLVNLWSAHMDPNVWKNPEEFNPERFLDKEGNVINRDQVISFSLGKRSCTGEVLARQELFLFIAGIIQRFEILPPENESKIINIMKPVRVLSPAPFTLRLIPLSHSS